MEQFFWLNGVEQCCICGEDDYKDGDWIDFEHS
jgi:hypothetical protein